MQALATELWPHGQIREIGCCVCQSRWNEMLLSAMLRVDRRHLGSICPRCLHRSPVEAGVWLMELSRSLTGAIGWIAVALKENPHEAHLPLEFEEARARAAIETAQGFERVSPLLRLRFPSVTERIDGTRWSLETVARGTAELFDEAERDPRVTADRSASDRLADLREAVAGEIRRIEDLLRVADRLCRQDRWSVSLEEVIGTERRLVARQFARRLCEASLRTIVDDRYRRFLQPGAAPERIEVQADRARPSASRHATSPLGSACAR